VLAPPAPPSAEIARHRALLERLAQQYCLVRLLRDADGHPCDVALVDANAAFRATTVGTRLAPGQAVRDVGVAFDAGWLAFHDAVVRTRLPARTERFEPSSGRWFDVQAIPFDDDDPTLVALVFDDVTTRRRAEEEQRASEERLRLSQEAGRVGVFEWDIAHDRTWWSSAQWKLFGHDPDATAGEPSALWRSALHPDDVAALDDAVTRCLSGERSGIRHELRIVRPDGEVRWIDVVAAITARDDDGAPVRLAGVNIDVTDRVQVAQVLRETEARFRIMADGLPHIVWVHDETGALRFVNRTYLDFFGVTQEQVLGEGWIPLTHPDDGTRYATEFLAAVAARTEFHSRVRVRDASGGWRVLESWGRPRFDEAGAFLGHVGTSVDVTDAQRAAAEREELARQRQLALDAARLGWFHMRPVDGTGGSDERVAAIFGIDDPEAPLDAFLHRIHPDDRPRVIAAIDAAIDPARAHPYAITYRVEHPEHGIRWVEAFGRAEFGDPAAPLATSFVGTVADITERKAAEEALREADRRKDDFLAMLAHELRNPLAPVRHAVEILRRSGTQPPHVGKAHDIIDRQVSHMARLIDDLLDVSRIARGRVQLRSERCDLAEIVRQTAESYRPTLVAGGTTLVVDAPVPVFVDGDPTRLAQVVGNVLHNATKFTPAGGTVTIRLVLDAAARTATVTVHDTGRGIDAALLPTLFEPFSQGEQAIDRSHGGLGLGLALVHGLVTMHGGRVDAASEGAGQGATITIVLPLAAEATPAAVPSPTLPERRALPARVLVVEDNRDAAEMLRLLLSVASHDVRIAHDGTEALATARGWPPEVILCDIGLPGELDGYAVARAVRADAALAGAWLVALSGYGQESDRTRARDAGFDRHVVKPADFATLDAALAARSARDEAAGGISSPASPGT
jgi:PAS domain S-box-containing protein